MARIAYIDSIPLGAWISERLATAPDSGDGTAVFGIGALAVALVPCVADPLPLFIAAGILHRISTGNYGADVEVLRPETQHGTGIFTACIHRPGRSCASCRLAGSCGPVTRHAHAGGRGCRPALRFVLRPAFSLSGAWVAALWGQGCWKRPRLDAASSPRRRTRDNPDPAVWSDCDECT